MTATAGVRPDPRAGLEPEEEMALDCPEVLDVLASGTRRRILELLSDEEMTVSQVARALGVPRANLYHHVEQLVDAGLVELSQEVTVGRMTVRFYRATARRFRVAVVVGDGGQPAPNG